MKRQCALGALEGLPALVAGHAGAALLTADGEVVEGPSSTINPLLRTMTPPVLLHGPATLRMLGLPPEPQPVPWLDVLELFLLVRPGQSPAPTAQALAAMLGVGGAAGPEGLLELAATLLGEALQLALDPQRGPIFQDCLRQLDQAGWSWGPVLADLLMQATSLGVTLPQPARPGSALAVADRLPEWEDEPPRPVPGTQPLLPGEATKRLAKMRGPGFEPRPGQEAYAELAAHAFSERPSPEGPALVLAEAGTGTGKTLGYLAPASLWAARNSGTVWISTFTRHLQGQVAAELARLYPDKAERQRKVVVRKGRENYFCLLNFTEIAQALQARQPNQQGSLMVALVLLARWAESGTEGDLHGGDLPGWFSELFRPAWVRTMADRRGECLHSACPFYQCCFIEHSVRRARQAELVIANHALTLNLAFWQAQGEAYGMDENGSPTRYVFDEAHHLAQAADSVFGLLFSGVEAYELRRWLLGREQGRARGRGLRQRMETILQAVPEAAAPLNALLLAAQATLPLPGWQERLAQILAPEEPAPGPATVLATGETDPGNPATPLAESLPLPGVDGGMAVNNPAETVLHALARQLLLREASQKPGKGQGDHGQDSQCELHPATDELARVAPWLAEELSTLLAHVNRLLAVLGAKLEGARQKPQGQEGVGDAPQPGQDSAPSPTPDPPLDMATLQLVASIRRSLAQRALGPLTEWLAIMKAIAHPPGLEETEGEESAPTARIGYVRRTAEHDVGVKRHWLDPTVPMAQVLGKSAHGVLMTSATLRDGKPEPAPAEGTHSTPHPTPLPAPGVTAWQQAERATGACHFKTSALHGAVASPFDYSAQARVFIITDMAPGMEALAQAYQRFFMASQGGGLGLFTAIARLRGVYERIKGPLGAAGIPLHAQHVSAMGNQTLVDVFREDIKSCLLGTDAMRDGVDVPGDALRLVVFERTPWARPDILHRARKKLLPGSPRDYEDRLARMKLRQAFGRLIRRGTDKGVFALLDRRTPSRLLTAFPPTVPIERLPLAEALVKTQQFLNP
ncbi:ATP-dependent DNA helicase [Formicincola oecophyllae]|uniref:ATP-dependent DNA helicase n=1 Tax=Formicincola oecophyllae TaxID=2558361 RepID=A0A4Y6UC01_9PROT|nr:ATP-dependent DNA helicase [Formicincola oecophyllae]